MNNGISDETVKDWLKTIDVIKEFLKILRPDMSEGDHQRNAAVIIARLSDAGYLIGKHEV